jgi:hypothetical protein
VTTQLPNYDRWLRCRMYQLDFWGELWKIPPGHPDAAGWAGLAADRGVAAFDDADLKHRITRGLLPEVIHAAGGVELAVARIREALIEAQLWSDQVTPKPTGPNAHFAAPTLAEAGFAFTELVVWTRTLFERVSRRERVTVTRSSRWFLRKVPRFRTRAKPKAMEVGLLPSLANSPLRDSVRAAFLTLAKATRGTREWSNYGLHYGLPLGPSTLFAEADSAGKVSVRLPNPPSKRLMTWEAYEFTQGLELLPYAESIVAAVADFVDTTLIAFAAARPTRVGGPLPASAIMTA